MHAMMVTFKLNGMSSREYAETFGAGAADLAGVPGLVSKTWLASDESGAGGGFYLWRSREDMQAFLGSGVIDDFAGHPAIVDLRVQDYPVLEGPSRLTRGLPEATVAG